MLLMVNIYPRGHSLSEICCQMIALPGSSHHTLSYIWKTYQDYRKGCEKRIDFGAPIILYHKCGDISKLKKEL